MELDDCAFPLLAGIVRTDDANRPSTGPTSPCSSAPAPAPRAWSAPTCCRPTAPSSPRARPSRQRRRRHQGAGGGQPGQHQLADRHEQRPGHRRERFTAMTRLDHNRAKAQLAAKTGVPSTTSAKVTIWGNHSATQYPDIFHAEVNGKNAAETIDDQAWLENDFIPTVQKRGAAIIEARGASSGVGGQRRHRPRARLGPRHPRGRLGVDGVPSDGSYGVPEGLMSSFPCACKDGRWEIVQGLDIDDFSRGPIDASVGELAEERDAVRSPQPNLSRTRPTRPARSPNSGAQGPRPLTAASAARSPAAGSGSCPRRSGTAVRRDRAAQPVCPRMYPEPPWICTARSRDPPDRLAGEVLGSRRPQPLRPPRIRIVRAASSTSERAGQVLGLRVGEHRLDQLVLADRRGRPAVRSFA